MALIPDLELVLFIGLQASGKTSFYNTRFAHTHAHVSKDRLRKNRRPEPRQQQLIRKAAPAAHRLNQVIDNCKLKHLILAHPVWGPMQVQPDG